MAEVPLTRCSSLVEAFRRWQERRRSAQAARTCVGCPAIVTDEDRRHYLGSAVAPATGTHFRVYMTMATTQDSTPVLACPSCARTVLQGPLRLLPPGHGPTR